MNDYGWLWWPNDIRGPRGLKLPDICLTGEEKPRKNLSQETCPDRGSNPGPLRGKRACYHWLHSGGLYHRVTTQIKENLPATIAGKANHPKTMIAAFHNSRAIVAGDNRRRQTVTLDQKSRMGEYLIHIGLLASWSDFPQQCYSFMSDREPQALVGVTRWNSEPSMKQFS